MDISIIDSIFIESKDNKKGPNADILAEEAKGRMLHLTIQSNANGTK